MRRAALALLIVAIGISCTGPAPTAATSPVAATSAPGAARSAEPTVTPSRAAVTPSASPSPAPLVLSENDAWSRIGAAMASGVAVVKPTWLPATIDRAKVALEQLDPAAPGYRIRYSSAAGSLSFELGPVPPLASESALGTRVRGANAILRHPYDANEVPRPKLLTWNEGANTYSIRATEGISGDDLMRAAWALTSTTPEPSRPYPYLRKKVGACTRPGMTAEEVVRATLALTSSGDADAINDCFALERIEQSPLGFAGWSQMGPVRDVQLRSLGTRGGRDDIGATWTFERDPGGAWGFPQAGQFFTVGLEGDRLRIFELATAIGKLPL